MARAVNVNLGSRVRQFLFLIVVTVLGMILSTAFYGGMNKKQSLENDPAPTPATASF